MSTAKLFQKLSSPRSKNRSTSNRCPVEETGRNSVTPSTMPRITALIVSEIMIWSGILREKPGPSRLFASPLQCQNAKTRLASAALLGRLRASRPGGYEFVKHRKSIKGFHVHAAAPPVLSAFALYQ